MKEQSKPKKVATNAATHAKNAAEVVTGKAKSKAGKAVGNRRLEAEGNVEIVKGKMKQVGQRVKEALDD